MELLAEYYGHSEKERTERWGDPGAMGKLIGVSAATVRRAKKDKRVKALVKEYLDNQLLYDVVEARAVTMHILRNEKCREDTRLKAVRTIEQLAGNLSGNAPQINITNDFSTFEGMSTQDLLREGRNIFGNDVDDEG